MKKLKIFYILSEGNLGIFDFKIFLYMDQIRVKLEEKEKNCETWAEGLDKQNAKGLRQTLRNDRRGGINGDFFPQRTIIRTLNSYHLFPFSAS